MKYQNKLIFITLVNLCNIFFGCNRKDVISKAKKEYIKASLNYHKHIQIYMQLLKLIKTCKGKREICRLNRKIKKAEEKIAIYDLQIRIYSNYDYFQVADFDLEEIKLCIKKMRMGESLI